MNIILNTLAMELNMYLDAFKLFLVASMYVMSHVSIVLILIDAIDKLPNAKLVTVIRKAVYETVSITKRLVSQVMVSISWYTTVHIIVTY